MADKSPGSQPTSPVISRTARTAISAFLAFHLFAIVVWSMPLDSPLTQALRGHIRAYVVWIGLFQKWDMFAPDPSKLNNYVSAVITHADGQVSVWNFPRMQDLGFVDKYFKERYRKFANDNLRLDMFAPLWPDAARYVARMGNRSASPPLIVELVRHWSPVPPPDSASRAGQWSQYTFYHHLVKPEDLR